MLITKLIQDVQACFKNPYSDAPHPYSKLITKLYQEFSGFVLESPVSISRGYGCALGVRGTYRERVERFIRLIQSSFDPLKRLYTANINDVAAHLFLFDIGAAKVNDETRKECEANPSKLDICGQTVILIQNAALLENLGTSINQLIVDIPLLYKRLAGDSEVAKGTTEIILSSNLITMDMEAIDSIKERIENDKSGPK